MISLYSSDLSPYYDAGNWRRRGRRKLLRSDEATRRRLSCSESHSDAQDALDYLEDFLDHLSDLKDDGRLTKVPTTKVSYWETVISSVKDHFPEDERRNLLMRREQKDKELKI